ncbi:MAG: hypothetical protein WD004_08735 [Actinomycetota bacterium]
MSISCQHDNGIVELLGFELHLFERRSEREEIATRTQDRGCGIEQRLYN